jgi:hypothetical protein
MLPPSGVYRAELFKRFETTSLAAAERLLHQYATFRHIDVHSVLARFLRVPQSRARDGPLQPYPRESARY